MTNNLLIGLLLSVFAVNIYANGTVHKPTEVLSVYDGDTFKSTFEVWPNVMITSSVRVMGVDTPEMRGKCQAEKDLAIQAQQFTEQELRGDVRVIVLKNDKYGGRVDATVLTNGEDLATKLIEAGLGRPYSGGKRGSWCNGD